MTLAATTEDAMNKAGTATNGSGAKTPQSAGAAAAKGAVRPRDARQSRFAQSFAQIVAVLMRDRNFRNMRLADLEWLVLPPVMAGQFSLAQAPSPHGRAKGKEAGKEENAVLVPVAVALWARVSDAIDKRLSESLDKPIQLGVGDWASGSNVWLIAVAGDQRMVPKFLEQLSEKQFKGQKVKMRLRGPDNTVVVKTLGQPA